MRAFLFVQAEGNALFWLLFVLVTVQPEGVTNPRPLTPPLMRFRKRRFGCSKMCLCLALSIPNSKRSYPLLSVSNLPSNK